MKKTVVILGSPRSGTSMTAGILSIMGVDMGKVRKPDHQNPRGYFEDLDFLSLCNEIIKDANTESDGFNLPKINDIKESQHKFEGRFRKLINRKKKETTSDIWGWKATTTSLFIDSLLPYIEDPYFLIVHRNQLDVAKSAVKYTKRKNYQELTIDQALINMHYYYNRIYEFINDYPKYPKLHLSFEDIISDPETEAKRISSFLNLTVDTTSMERIKNYVLTREEIKKERKLARFKNNLIKNRLTRWIYHKISYNKFVPIWIKNVLESMKNKYKNY